MDETYNLNGGFKPTNKRFADLDGPDFFPTPGWATMALLDNETFVGEIWEPACGNGAMAEVLKSQGYSVIASDLYDRGYGMTGIDFLTSDMSSANIITNPPYNSAENFIKSGMSRFQGKFALLLRLAFLEGSNRYKTIFSRNPPSRVWVFSERITFYPEGAVRAGSGTTAYAWFVWDKSSAGQTELKWIRPGYKKAYESAGTNPMLFK